MPNLTPFEIALLILGAVLIIALGVILWWHLAGDRVKALIAGWMALPLFWKIVLPVVFGAFVLHGSVKRGEVVGEGEGGEDFNRVEQVERVEGGVVGDSCSGRKEGEKSTLQLQLKTTTSQIVERVEIEDWHRHGVWKYKDAKIEFKHGFLFPFGTNHLSSAVVVSQGRVRSSYFDAEGFVSLGANVAMFSGESRFAYEYKSSLVPGRDSYSFIWENVFVDRMRANPMNARIELFRNGDISITSNGVQRTLPRELPFAHDDFGQDEEWVRANFTNATEILSCGYAKWVDEQVGVGLTNGLYKLTVTVPETPLETTQLKVGDYSVAVTNAGEYVFLLEKGMEYPLSVFPETATNFVYSAVDDVAVSYVQRSMDGYWIRDKGKLELAIPIFPMGVSGYCSYVKWMPLLMVSPETWHPSESNPSEIFTAILTDYPFWRTPTYHWQTSDSDKIIIDSPKARTTEIERDYLQMDEGSALLWLEVSLGSERLYSNFNIEESPNWDGGSWDGPDFSFGVNLPKTLFVNNDDDNNNGDNDAIEILSSFADDDVVSGTIRISSDNLLNGTLKVNDLQGISSPWYQVSGVYEDTVPLKEIVQGDSYVVDGLWRFNKSIVINPQVTSASYLGSGIVLKWMPKSGVARNGITRFTIVNPVVEPICNETTNVVENGVERKLTVNPCGVVIGENAYFRIHVLPEDYPDDQIVWEAKGAGEVDFVNGNKGRQVTVRGLKKGKAELTIQIGDAKSIKPSFEIYVVEEKSVDLRVWMISGEDNRLSKTLAEVRSMIKGANDIYSQVGVHLNLIEPIVVTNIPGAFTPYYDAPQNSTNAWTF